MYITLSEYSKFKDCWTQGDYTGLRFGQAFYNHFNLHRLTDQSVVNTLYNVTDDADAKAIIFNLIDPLN